MSEVFSHNALPEGWEHRRLKTIAELRTSNVDKNKVEGERPVRLCNYTDVYYSDSIADADGLMEATATEEEIRRFGLRRDDVLVTKDSENADDIAVPAFVARDFEDVLCGYHLAILRPRGGLDGRYLYYALLTDRVGDQFAIGANGITRFGLSQSVLKDAVVPLPPFPTQRAIASFLDRETAKIDTLIEKKQRLLELLDEKRTALITRAVTRGLDADVPMKDSGVEWIGEIPEHWDVVPVYGAFDVQLGKMLDSKRITGEHLAPYLRNQDVQWRSINTEDLPVMDFDPADRKKYSLKPGDLLVCEGGDIGRSAIWYGEIEECYYQKALHRVRTRGLHSTEFLFYVMWAAAHMGVFEAGGNPNTITHLTATMLRHHRLPMAGPEEERQIVAKLDALWNRTETLKARIADAVSLLHEYRTTLISVSVTGKIVVRERPFARDG